MKPFKTSLHLFLTAASLLGFAGGWAALAHSRKPVQPNNSASTSALAPLPPLAPMPAMDSASTTNNAGGLFSIAPQTSRPRSRPLFITSGS